MQTTIKVFIFVPNLCAVADRNLIMKKSVEKILSNLLRKNPALKDVDSISLIFIFSAPVRSAMCDWVYGIKIVTKTPDANQNEISQVITQTITKTMSQISKDTLCATDINFESAY